MRFLLPFWPSLGAAQLYGPETRGRNCAVLVTELCRAFKTMHDLVSRVGVLASVRTDPVEPRQIRPYPATARVRSLRRSRASTRSTSATRFRVCRCLAARAAHPSPGQRLSRRARLQLFNLLSAIPFQRDWPFHPLGKSLFAGPLPLEDVNDHNALAHRSLTRTRAHSAHGYRLVLAHVLLARPRPLARRSLELPTSAPSSPDSNEANTARTLAGRGTAAPLSCVPAHSLSSAAPPLTRALLALVHSIAGHRDVR